MDHSVLHDEMHSLHRCDVGERISRHRDEISQLAYLHATEAIVDVEELRGD